MCFSNFDARFYRSYLFLPLGGLDTLETSIPPWGGGGVGRGSSNDQKYIIHPFLRKEAPQYLL